MGHKLKTPSTLFRYVKWVRQQTIAVGYAYDQPHSPKLREPGKIVGHF